MTEQPRRSPLEKSGLHPRNRHRAPYDFVRLAKREPALAAFVGPNRFGGTSVDFADPEAVRALNRAILKEFYGIAHWDLPPGYLCPPIPGRADYIHHAADLLGSGRGGALPRGPGIAVLDIGVGANCVYPIIGCREYGWRFVGSDIDPVALASARRMVDANRLLKGLVELRLQRDPASIFGSVIGPGETFDLSICNPPFHASPEEARMGAVRKRNNLRGRPAPGDSREPVLNFGGACTELWCEGGERSFIARMIGESARIPNRCRWFTTLVSKEAHLPRVLRSLKAVRPREIRTIDMAQGRKRSRLVAWTFAGGPVAGP